MLLLVLLPLLQLTTLSYGKLVDLSHDLSTKTYTHFGTFPKYNRTALFYGEYMPGVFVDNGWLASTEHTGTHMDAPSHFVEGGRTLNQIPLEESVADGVMLDFAAEASKDRWFAVTIDKILAWEDKHGRIPDNAAVLIRFGWDEKFKNPADYLGTSNFVDTTTYKFPFVTRDAGLWLHKNRKLLYLGTDTITPDPYNLPNGTVSGHPIHVQLLKDNRYIVENMHGLGELPARGFRFYCAPVKYVGSSGAPVRAFAVVHDNESNGASALTGFRESRDGLCVLVFLAALTVFLGRV